jgi:chaperonin GroES
MALDLIPLGERVIILKKDVPEKVGRIIVPETSREMEPTEGEVVAIGDAVTNVKVGDFVFFGRYSGFTFERDGAKYVFCNAEDILAIVNNKNSCSVHEHKGESVSA